MLRKIVVIEGQSYTLGEPVAGVVEDAQEQGKNATTEMEALRVQRGVLAHALNRGGFSISADELPQKFSYSELRVLWAGVMELLGGSVAEGEARGP